MKIISNIITLVSVLLILAGCGKDNYDEPKSTLVGRVTYQGEALQIRGTGEAVRLQLYQNGYAKHDPINVYVGQDGAFSAKLFNGEYKLVTRDGNGPWVNSRDTMIVNVKGSTEIEVNVTPYYLINNEAVSVSVSEMSASFTIKQVVPAASINKVMLILSKTQFADDVNNLFRKDFTGIEAGSISLTADISGNSSVTGAPALFARIGVLANGADQAIYSSVIRIR